MSRERPFGGGKRPPYVPQHGTANFFLIAEKAGLDPSKFATEDYVGKRGMAALYELFSEGEIVIYDPALPFQASDPPEVRHGEFYSKISKLLERAKSEPGSVLDKEFNKLARACGMMFAAEALRGVFPVGAQSEVQATIDQSGAGINYAGHRLRINPHSIIMDVGPGVVGRQFIDLQAELLNKGQTPFSYLAITDGPFVNSFLQEYGKGLYDRNPRTRNLFSKIIETGFFSGREDGFSRSLDFFLNRPELSNGAGFVDIAICNGLGRADGEELSAGLSQIYRLIKPGGHLLLGSLVARTHERGLSFDEQLALVSDKFDIVTQTTRESGLALAGRQTEASFAVLQRKSA